MLVKPNTRAMKTFPTTRSRITRFLKLLIILLLLCFAYAVLVEPYWPEVRTTVFRSEQVPTAFRTRRILLLSDIHFDRYFAPERLAQIVDKANGLRPDLIVLGGDYVSGDEEYIAPCFKELGRLEAPLGVYGVTGNHDSDTGYRAVVRAMREAGITPLENAGVWLETGGQRIRLGGVKTSYGQISDAGPALGDATAADFVILVSHNPDFAEELDTDRVDLMLSGHTHGGQLTFFGLWAPYIPSDYGQKYRRGLIQAPRTQVLVSSGIGTSFLPLRFGARPQLSLIELEG